MSMTHHRRAWMNESAENALSAVERATDAELVARFARQRERAALAELVDKHASMVASVCQQILGRGADADDAFQATFLILARRCSAIRKASSVASWLHGVAYRTAIRMARRRSNPPTQPLSDAAGDDEGVLSMIQRRELQRIVHDELEAMPARYRDVLVLHYLEGLSRDRIAEELECTEAAVKGKLARGRKQLRIQLARRGVGLSIAAAAVTSSAASASAELCASTVGAAVGLHTEGGPPAAGARAQQLAQQGVHAMMFTSSSKIVGVAGATVLIASLAMLDPADYSSQAQEKPGGAALILAAAAESAEPDAATDNQAGAGVAMAKPSDEAGAAADAVSLVEALQGSAASALVPAEHAGDDRWMTLVDPGESRSASVAPQTIEASSQWRALESELAAFEAQYRLERAKAFASLEVAKKLEVEAHSQPEEGRKEDLLAQSRREYARGESQLLGSASQYESRQAEVLTRRARLLREWTPAAAQQAESTVERKSQVDSIKAATPPAKAYRRTLPVTISPGDVVHVEVAGSSLNGPVRVESSGAAPLGALFGRVSVAGVTLEQAEQTVKKHLVERGLISNDVPVQVTWPVRGQAAHLGEAPLRRSNSAQPSDALPPETISAGDVVHVEVAGTSIDGSFRVERSGAVPLGALAGRVKIYGLTLEEAEQVIKQHLDERGVINDEGYVQVSWPMEENEADQY